MLAMQRLDRGDKFGIDVYALGSNHSMVDPTALADGCSESGTGGLGVRVRVASLAAVTSGWFGFDSYSAGDTRIMVEAVANQVSQHAVQVHEKVGFDKVREGPTERLVEAVASPTGISEW